MVPVAKMAFCMVVHEHKLAGLYAGTPEEAWSQAADHSARVHIILKPRPFHTVLSRAPLMYDDMWVGGKCMYKLEPVVADGGELIVYAPAHPPGLRGAWGADRATRVSHARLLS